MEELFPFYLILVPVLGVVAQWLAWRFHLPSILLLLVFGIGLGIWIRPDTVLAELMGSDESAGPKLLFPVVSLSVGIILFEGGLTLRWRQLGGGGRVLWRLLLVSSLVTWGMTTLLSHYLLGFSWQLSTLLGAILLVTGPTVVGPLLRQIRPKRRVGSILHWEGILIDPIGAVAAVLVFRAISHPVEMPVLDIAWSVLHTLAIGLVFGGLAAASLVVALKKYWVPDFLHGVVFLVVALGVFWISNVLQEEAGLVTVTVLGICLANQRFISVEHVLEFKEHLRVLLISCLFIVLGSRLQLSSFSEIGWVGIPFVLMLIFIVRPISVFLATIGNRWDWKEKLFVGMMAPRGIVAAAVASVFGLKLATLSGENAQVMFENAALLSPVTFMVILGTVAFCGLAAGPLAKWLELADANPQGILFAGASRWVREVALALKKFDIRVILIDTNYGNVTAARLADLSAMCGNVLSEQMQEEQDLAGIGNFLAVTPSDEVNTLAAMEYMHLFSRAHVFQLPSRGKSHGRWESIPENRRGRQLFQADLDHRTLDQLFEQGATVKATTLTESYRMPQFREKHGRDAIVLFAIDDEGKLKVRTVNGTFEPGPGDHVIAIVQANEVVAANEHSEQQATTSSSVENEA